MRYAFPVVTSLLCLGLVGAAYADFTSPEIAAGVAHLSFPTWFPAFLGVWKLLGALAIAAPGFPRLKEWAHAGVFFNLSSAAIAHLITGDGFGKAAPPLVFLALAMASWALRPASRKL